jgi:2',3'-cyclic-nucleotide 2'-phosphodiesterase (5'-nucleotidase family)
MTVPTPDRAEEVPDESPLHRPGDPDPLSLSPVERRVAKAHDPAHGRGARASAALPLSGDRAARDWKHHCGEHDVGGHDRRLRSARATRRRRDRATLTARIRADLAKQGTPVWLIDAGDFYYYSAFSNEYHGVADVVRAEFGVEVEFESPGGMHLPILAGPVTRAMLADLDQRPYTIVTFRMRGSEIRRFVQRSKPVASGLRYRMFCGRLEEITVGGAPLDDARVYSCAGSSALAGRLEGFETLEMRDTKRLGSDVVIAALRKAGTMAPAYDGRRVVADTLRTGIRPE